MITPNTYYAFQFTLKGLLWKVEYNGYKEEERGHTETFKVTVAHGENSTHYNFNNSVMEWNISEYVKQFRARFHQSIRLLREEISRRFSWGGYDKVKSLRQLEKERIERLAYSIVHDFAYYPKFTDYNRSFKEFCDNHGYSDDSIKAKKVYEACIEIHEKANSLQLTEEQLHYLENVAGHESERFEFDIKKALGEGAE